jgi:hypothetical protein
MLKRTGFLSQFRGDSSMRAKYVLFSLAVLVLATACHSKKGGGYFAPAPVTSR